MHRPSSLPLIYGAFIATPLPDLMPSANFTPSTIWTGDNLPIMRGMNSACVDLIYLDPPFNSNRTYEAPIGSKAAGASFKDAWTLSDVDVCEHGELADRNPAVYAVIEAARQAHGKGMQSYLIFMAVRLLEMQRILKSTGSIYLHCDPTASHYLKLLMDGIFGKENFRNEISWRRTTTKNDYKQGAKNWPRVRDVVLHYALKASIFNQQFASYSNDYVRKFYRYTEEGTGRKYRLSDLAAPGAGTRGHPQYELMGITRYWRYNEEKMQSLVDAGRVVQSRPGSVPCYKRYLDEMPGVAVSDSWDDIPPVQGAAKERTGYPTQKPLALLDRIIKASSNPGDLVLDPFCGCATALVAADRLGRQWAGIDLSALAIKLVKQRILEDSPLWAGPVALDAPPKRTDLGNLPNYRTHRHRLYGEQEGVCVGCNTHFPFRVMDVDHILPRSKGGTDHPDNLQLLCSGCNRSKGGKTMAEWRTMLSRLDRG